MTASIEIASTVKNYPKLPYEAIKNEILGKGYIVSLAFVGEKKAQALNIAHRNKMYVPNVLAFPLEEKAGEIFITPKIAIKEAPKFSMSPNGYIGYLFVHALLHLKGLDHGDTMEKAEKKYCVKFNLE